MTRSQKVDSIRVHLEEVSDWFCVSASFLLHELWWSTSVTQHTHFSNMSKSMIKEDLKDSISLKI